MTTLVFSETKDELVFYPDYCKFEDFRIHNRKIGTNYPEFDNNLSENGISYFQYRDHFYYITATEAGFHIGNLIDAENKICSPESNKKLFVENQHFLLPYFLQLFCKFADAQNMDKFKIAKHCKLGYTYGWLKENNSVIENLEKLGWKISHFDNEFFRTF